MSIRTESQIQRKAVGSARDAEPFAFRRGGKPPFVGIPFRTVSRKEQRGKTESLIGRRVSTHIRLERVVNHEFVGHPRWSRRIA